MIERRYNIETRFRFFFFSSKSDPYRGDDFGKIVADDVNSVAGTLCFRGLAIVSDDTIQDLRDLAGVHVSAVVGFFRRFKRKRHSVPHIHKSISNNQDC